MAAIVAADSCPQWPNWVLMDSLTIKDALGLGDEHLEFYDTRYVLWVSCSPSYPHDVKSDCHLLLRHPGIVCTGFEMHLEHATEKPVHMRLNMPEECVAIKDQLHRHKNALPNPLVTTDLSKGDDEGELIRRVPRKQQCEDFDDIRPSQRTFIHYYDTPTFSPPRTSSPAPSSSFSFPTTPVTMLYSPPHLSYPESPQHEKVLVPATGKWPTGMYTCDMELTFKQVGSKALKRVHPLLAACLTFVLGRDIHPNTWHDQVCLWMQEASELQRNEFSMKGHVADGLWASFRKAVRS